MTLRVISTPFPCPVCGVVQSIGEHFEWIKTNGKVLPAHVRCATRKDSKPPLPVSTNKDLTELKNKIASIEENLARLDTKATNSHQKLEKQLEELKEQFNALDILRPIEVKISDKKPKIIKDSIFHPMFEHALRWIGLRNNIYLYGPPGSGKTTIGWQVGQVLEFQVSYLQLQPMTMESRVLGFIDANGTYRGTSFRQRYENGGVMIIDEMDNASDNMLTALNGAMSGDVCAFPDGDIKKHPDFIIVATGNTVGLGGVSGHWGRRVIDSATRDRFIFMQIDYDENMERMITIRMNKKAKKWLEYVRSIRKAADSVDGLVVSPRASYEGAKYLLAYPDANFDILADELIFKGVQSSIKSTIKNRIDRPLADRPLAKNW